MLASITPPLISANATAAMIAAPLIWDVLDFVLARSIWNDRSLKYQFVLYRYRIWQHAIQARKRKCSLIPLNLLKENPRSMYFEACHGTNWKQGGKHTKNGQFP